MAAKTKEENKRMNPFLWFLFAIVIPAVAALILAIIIMTVAGIDVAGWAKEKGNNIPGLANVMSTDEDKDEQRTKEQMQQMITNKEEEIDALNQQVTDLESTVGQMEQEIIRLENERASVEEEAENEGTPADETIGSIASSYEEMDSEEAAQVLQSTDQDLAVSILQELPSDVRGEIFEDMEPDYAATLTQSFVDQSP